MRRSSFRERGLPHELLVLTDLSRTLREEERNAWQRLVRVIGHEMNNSLAPIKSIAGSLETLIRRDPPPADWRDDARSGLNIIATRAESLSRFMQAYARLARLPPPQKEPVDLGELVRRVANLETRLAVRVVAGPEVIIQADAAQLEQLLINILHNAAEASLETGGNSNDRLARSGRMRRSICARHRTRNHESDEFVRAIFHDQAGRFWHWSGAEPADRGSAWRIVDPGESQRDRVAKRSCGCRSRRVGANVKRLTRIANGFDCSISVHSRRDSIFELSHNRDGGIPQPKLFQVASVFRSILHK